MPKFLTEWHVQTDQTAPEGVVWSGSALIIISLSILRNNCKKAKFKPKKYGIVFKILEHLLYTAFLLYTGPTLSRDLHIS